MPKLRQPAPNAKKRKITFSACESNSAEEDGDSTSASAPNISKTEQQKKQTSIGIEEVGENDEFPLLGSEFFKHRTSGSGQGVQNVKLWPLERNAYFREDFEKTKKAKTEVHANLARSGAKHSIEGLGSSMSSTRHCMQSVMDELREAREKLLQWMRQEMHDFLQGTHCGSSVHATLSKQSGRVETEERAVKPRMMGDCSPKPDSFGVQYGWHGRDPGEFAIASPINGIDKRAVHGGPCDSSEGGDAGSLQLLDAAHCREDFGLSKASIDFNKGLGTLRAESKKPSVGMDSGVNSEVGFEEEIKDTGGLRDAEVELIRNFERHNGINLGAGIQTQGSQRPVTDLGELPSSSGLFGYDSQRSCWSFKGSARESANGVKMRTGMSSSALCNSNTSSNDAGKLLENPFRISPQEGKPRLLDMHNQSATVDMQNPGQMNMMWNLVSQSGRTVDHPVHDSTISPFNYDSRSKVGNGGIEPYCDIGNHSSVYENSLALINSAIIPPANAAGSGQLPPRMQHIPQSNSCMPTLLAMPGQMAVRNPSNTQSFLGLSMNGLSGPAGNRQMFPGLYFNDNAQHSLVSANKLPSTTLQDSHRRGPVTQERGVLELNSLFL